MFKQQEIINVETKVNTAARYVSVFNKSKIKIKK